MIGGPIEIARQQLSKLGFVLSIGLILTAPVAASERGPAVTIAVFGLFRPERVDIASPQSAIFSIQNGSVDVKRVLAGGQRLQVERRGERLQIALFEHDGRVLLAHAADSVHTEETEWTVVVPGRMQRNFSGRLAVTARRGELLTRITVHEESAVQQILRSEMAGSQQPEALKAQAILVRAYLRTSTGRHLKEGYDFCDTTHCQFFTDFKAGDDQFSRAALATRGLILMFLGKPFQPLYTAACGGRTLAGFVESDVPKQRSGYPHRSVSCGFCASHPLFEWETTVEKQPLLRALQGKSSRDPAQTLARLTEPGEAGELGALKQATRRSVGRLLGWNIIRSNRYSIAVRSNSVRIQGRGSGHNFGLCQAGAIEMSRQGKAMVEILGFYFPGARITQ
jgi:stage II sporulation protein D